MAKTKKEPTQGEGLQDIGRRAFESIADMVNRLDTAIARDDDKAREAVEQEIQEDPLSLRVRSGWCDVGESTSMPEEYEILLGTGGPAVRIVGTLDEHGEPCSARLEAQDWGTPWTEYRDHWDSSVLSTYARQFVYVT